MNYFIYKEELQKNPNFDKEHTFMVDLFNLDYTEHEDGNEARQTIQTSNLNLRLELEEHGGNHTPISVSRNTDGSFRLDDGHNRARELQALGIPTAKAIMSTYESPSERAWGMLNDNIVHVTMTGTSKEDIARTVVREIDDNRVFGSDLMNVTDSRIEGLITKNFHKKLHHKTLRWVINAVQEDLVQGTKQFLNYASKAEVVEKFNKINPWGIKVNKRQSGDICTDKWGQKHSIYFAGTKTAVSQNNLHGAYNMKLSNKDVKVMVVVYVDKPHTVGNIDNHRKKCLEIAKNTNGLYKLYDRVVVMPQVLKASKKGSKDDMGKLVEKYTVEL